MRSSTSSNEPGRRALSTRLRALASSVLTSERPAELRTRYTLADTRRRRPAAHWLITAPLLVLLLGLALLWLQSLNFEAARDLREGSRSSAITLLDDNGLVMARIGDGQGNYVTLGEMSPWLPAAVIAIEDRRFYGHLGIDPIGIARATFRNLIALGVVEGGSTITQQLAKLAFVGPERSFTRKIKEAAYALSLERRLSKEQILEAYLNKVYLGGGAYGVDAAARRYFGKTAGTLSLAESAMLAGLIKAPSRFAPTRKLERAQARARVVLQSMVEQGAVDRVQAERAIAAPATLAGSSRNSGDQRYFTDWVAAESHLYTSTLQPRLTVQTTFDQALQRHAEAAADAVFERHADKADATQLALVAMTPDGRIKAMLGGRRYRESQFNRAVQARRQPGSAFKLFLYLAALDEAIQPDNRISALPIDVDGWRPRNADDAYPKRVTIAHAFTHSVNTAAVRLAEYIGRDKIVQKARQLGITSRLHDHPSLALGSAEVTLLELTAAYATVANGGSMVWPEGIVSITGADRATLYQRSEIDERVLSADAVAGMTRMLEDTLIEGTGWRAQMPGFVAGKTGTSSDYRDAWFIGFTHDLVVGVWVGNDDGKPMQQASGGGLPAMIFKDFLTRSRGAPEPLPAPVAGGEAIAGLSQD
ncbi:MAG: PBP1A family penicillin-binding protein [Alphaproteobacteria bacterium]